MARMDEGEGKRGQGDRSKKRDKENRNDSHGAVGSRVVTQLGITHGNEGDEAAVAFYPDLFIILLTRSRARYLYYKATLCTK